MNVVLEISDRKGMNTIRVHIPASGLTVGRAWDSDVLVQDKFVDANHLILLLSEHGTLLIEENNSHNGTLVNGEPINRGANSYQWGAPIRIGDTTLRLFEVNTEVAKAEPRSKWFSIMTYFQSWKALPLIAICAITIHTFQKSAHSIVSFDISDAMLEIILTASILLVWGLLFGGLSKLIRGQSNMKAHIALISLYIIFVALSTCLVYILRFNLQSQEIGALISTLVFGLSVLVLVFGLLTYMTHLEDSKKWFWSALAMILMCAIPYKDRLMKEDHEQWVSGTKTETIMLPPAFLVRNSVKLDDYFERSSSLFEEQE